MSENKEKLIFPKYKRVKIDWEKLNSIITASGFSLQKLSSETGIGINIFNATKGDHKMNPLIIEELCYFLNIKVSDICKNIEFKRLSNGGSHNKRVAVNWELLKKDASNNGFSVRRLSETIGKSDSYLSNCHWIGGINEDILIIIADILKSDYRKYLIENEDKRKEMVDVICNIYNI